MQACTPTQMQALHQEVHRSEHASILSRARCGHNSRLRASATLALRPCVPPIGLGPWSGGSERAENWPYTFERARDAQPVQLSPRPSCRERCHSPCSCLSWRSNVCGRGLAVSCQSCRCPKPSRQTMPARRRGPNNRKRQHASNTHGRRGGRFAEAHCRRSRQQHTSVNLGTPTARLERIPTCLCSPAWHRNAHGFNPQASARSWRALARTKPTWGAHGAAGGWAGAPQKVRREGVVGWRGSAHARAL